MHQGRLVEDGEPVEVIDKYHAILSMKEGNLSSEKKMERQPFASQAIEGIEPPKQKSEAQLNNEQQPKTEPDKEGEEGEEVKIQSSRNRRGGFEAEITRVLIKSSEKGRESDTFISGEMASVRLRIRCNQKIDSPSVGMIIMKDHEGNGVLIYNTNTVWRNMNLGCFDSGTEFEVHFNQRLSLPEGKYYLNVGVANTDASKLYDWQENRKSFQIMMGNLGWKGQVDLNSQIVILK